MYRESAFQRGSLRTSGVVCVQAGESAYQQGRLASAYKGGVCVQAGESAYRRGSLRTSRGVCAQVGEDRSTSGKVCAQAGESAYTGRVVRV